jgi:hypothetical protein
MTGRLRDRHCQVSESTFATKASTDISCPPPGLSRLTLGPCTAVPDLNVLGDDKGQLQLVRSSVTVSRISV